MQSAKEKMEAALIELMKTRDIETISIKELIGKAGVNRSSYYYYYNSVIDILDEVIQKFVEQFRLTLDFQEEFVYGAENEDYIRRKMKIFSEYVVQHKETFMTIVESNMKYRLYDKLIECGLQALKKYKREYVSEEKNLKMPDRDEQYWDSMMVYGAIGALECWRRRKFEESVDDWIQICYGVVYHKAINVS